MKTTKAFLVASMVAVAMACEDKDSKPENAITSEEAAVIVSSSLASNTSGVSFVSGKAADVTDDLLADNEGGRVATCGLSQNIDLSGASPEGSAVSYSYDFSYKFRLNCNAQNAPEEVSVDLSYSGAFDGPKLKAEHNGVSELDLTGLNVAASNYLLNGLYKRSGSFENKEQQKAGSSTVEVTLKDISINKKTHTIVSGTGTYLIEGTVPSKGTFKYTGEVTFEGSDAAQLNVEGDKFNLNLKTGEVSKKQG